jgi:hypothetical protein
MISPLGAVVDDTAERDVASKGRQRVKMKGEH